MGPLVDTSVIVDGYRGAASPEVAAFRRLLFEGPAPATMPIVLQEVLQGAKNEHDLGRLVQHLSGFEPLAAASYTVHEHAAEIFRRARRAGLTSATVDVLIVATAAAHRRRLLTSDAVQRRVAAIAGVELA
jgi:predicted nucleic acid-binding protein